MPTETFAVQCLIYSRAKMRVTGLPCDTINMYFVRHLQPTSEVIHSRQSTQYTQNCMLISMMLTVLLAVQPRQAVRMRLASETGKQAMRLESGT